MGHQQEDTMGKKKKKKTAILLTFSALSFAVLLAITGPDHPSAEAIESITMADLKSHLYFLASDEMRGRDVNTVSNEIASRYLAHRFELMGLKPVENDSYFQYFSLVRAKLSEPNRLEIQHSQSPLSTIAILKKDFVPWTFSANARVSAPLVFVGYGITALEHRYDDYHGIDVRGTIVVMMNHEPGEKDPNSPFEGLVHSEYNRVLYKILNAQAHGAVGAIFIPDEANHPRTNFSRTLRSVWPEDALRERYSLKLWSDQVKIPALHVSREIAGALVESSKTSVEKIQKKIDQGYQPHSFPLLGVEATVETAVIRSETRVRNVLAYLPGSDPRLKDEVVIVSAHFDHVGSRKGEVFNGADDNASGTVGLLEVAEAYALSSEKPKRSMLFVGWNAEERGLLGSRYYVERPTFPLEKTTAVFQMDMIGRNEEVPDPQNSRFRGLEKQTAEENANSVNVMGYSRSQDLRHLVVQNNQRIGLDVRFRYDNNTINLLRRSDNWPFLINGVPALFFHTGLHPDYHQPTDTPDKINYSKMEKIVRLVFLSSWNAANASTPPRLNKKWNRR
ncbi:M28 family peptidase [Acidobacteria bacterium AH-259-G07]|nr:M28 family peptidase [Acidobacteria bacterium AH-259-G07]